MNKSEKSFDTGLRVLEVLKILLRESVSKNELIEKLKGNSKIETVYTHEAFIKYFNTLEILGLKITKSKNKYSLNNALFEISLTKEEREMLFELISESRVLHNKNEKEKFKDVIFRLNKYINPHIKEEVLSGLFTEKEQIKGDDIRDNLLTTLNNFFSDKQLVKIKFQRTKNQTDEVIVEIKEIFENKNNIYLKCYSPGLGRNKKISIDSIISVSQLPRMIQGGTCLNSVIFELYGRLASAYKLKPSEKVINFSNNHITVSNCEEDKDALLCRLLKYGENCKIINPKHLRDEFIEMTNEILKNLEEEE